MFIQEPSSARSVEKKRRDDRHGGEVIDTFVHHRGAVPRHCVRPCLARRCPRTPAAG